MTFLKLILSRPNAHFLLLFFLFLFRIFKVLYLFTILFLYYIILSGTRYILCCFYLLWSSEVWFRSSTGPYELSFRFWLSWFCSYLKFWIKLRIEYRLRRNFRHTAIKRRFLYILFLLSISFGSSSCYISLLFKILARTRRLPRYSFFLLSKYKSHWY